MLRKTHKIIIIVFRLGLLFSTPETGFDVAGIVYLSRVNEDQKWYISNEEDKCTDP
jgi:hypothetical protein